MIEDFTTNCPHVSKFNLSNNIQSTDFPFIKLNSPKAWVCIQDGCFKKTISRRQLINEAKRLDTQHRIFIEMQTLEIFCTICEAEVTDKQYPILKEIRSLAIEIDPQQEKIIFGGNMEYPPSFQKEKIGVCGIIDRQLNSYVGALLQLFAHTPTFYNIAQENRQPHSVILHKLFQKIRLIRSGKYRIIKIQDLETIISAQNQQFQNYSEKNPSSLQYQILRVFSDEFCYDGPECPYNSILNPVPLNILNPSKKNYKSYGPMKQLFSGCFCWIAACQVCLCKKTIKNEFQCIRLECQQEHKQSKEPTNLIKLIESTFNMFSSHSNPFSIENGPKVCEKCKKKDEENYFIVNKQQSNITMPNLLLLQFGSKGETLKVNLPQILDLSEFTNKIGEESVYQYLGCTGKIKKKYVTHIKEEKQKQPNKTTIKNYLFNGAIIKQDTKIDKPVDIKTAIYSLKPLLKNKTLAKNIESSIQVDVKCIVPLPDFWYHYLINLRHVPPLVNPFICIHGYLKPAIKTKAHNIRKIPPEIYDYLLQQFGGIKCLLVNGSQKCQTCRIRLNLLKQIKASQKEMAKFADKLSHKKNRVCIDKQWLQKWRKYLYQECHDTYLMQGHRRPGPINNRRGINEDQSIDDEKYKKISPEVWYFFKKFYGGGPLIRTVNVEPSLALVQAVDLRYEAIKDKIERYLKRD